MQDNNLVIEKKQTSKTNTESNKIINKQHIKGKLTALERINLLFDEDTFEEYDAGVVHRCTNFGLEKKVIKGDGVITGSGLVKGRLVYAYSQDFLNFGGSLSETNGMKICKIMDMAAQNGAPIVGMNDSGGARIQEGIDSLSGYGEIFQRNVRYSGFIPQLSLIMGPCAGGAVYSPALTDFISIVDQTSYMFVTGPDVVKEVMNEDIDKEELGGAEIHSSKSGVANFIHNDDIDAIIHLQKLLAFIPSNNKEGIKKFECSDSIKRSNSILNHLIDSNSTVPYDVHLVINEIVDDYYFLEVSENFAKNIVIGFARMGGINVGIVANQPMHLAGCLDINSSIKAARFIRFCDAFSIPIISLIDVPGFLPGAKQEHDGIITKGAKLLYAYAEATVPKISLIMRKAYGGAYIVMNSKHLSSDINYSWPIAEIAVMGAEGAGKILFRNMDKDAYDEQIKLYKEKFSNPNLASSRGYIDGIIQIEETRFKLCNALKNLCNKKEIIKIDKKHDNLPL